MKTLSSCTYPARQRGFALVELFWAITIGLVVIVTTMSTITHHLALLRNNSGYLRARLAAMREMERLKSTPWATLVASTTATQYWTPGTSTDPDLAKIYPNGLGISYFCPFPFSGSQAEIRQFIVAFTTDSTTNYLPNNSTGCSGLLAVPSAQVIQFTTLIHQYEPAY